MNSNLEFFFFTYRDNFSSFQNSWESACCTVKEKLNKIASCSGISFLSNFKVLFGMLLAALDLLISKEEVINVIYSLSVGVRKKELYFHLRGNQKSE